MLSSKCEFMNEIIESAGDRFPLPMEAAMLAKVFSNVLHALVIKKKTNQEITTDFDE